MRFSPVLALVWASSFGTAAAQDPWFIVDAVTISEPMEVNDIILMGNGSLRVTGVPDPGLRVSGNLWALGSSEVLLEDSVIQFMSTYHGQYTLAAAETSRVTVSGCDYRVPHGVQHALFAVGSAELVVEDTDFGDVQLLAGETARMEASRLNGNFEVIVQHDAHMELADIPRDPEAGRLWVWVEFPAGSEAAYTPPMPGFVDAWSFPPPGSTGIAQSVLMDRCEAMLWPMLVRENSRLTLRDIPEANWVVVGLHMRTDAVIADLHNQTLYVDEQLALTDREIRLENASIDTWNVYPQAFARVAVRDSHLGEILSMEDSRVLVERSTIDGTGGFFGARDRSTISATRCHFTCTIEAAHESTVALHDCLVEPYTVDPTGAFTRFGAYDQARLYASQTPVLTTPALGGQGLIAATAVADLPDHPPAPGETVELHGIAALFSLDPEVAPGSWRLDLLHRVGGRREHIAGGEGNVEEGFLGSWTGAEPGHDQRLEFILTDGLGRKLTGGPWVLGTGPRIHRAEAGGRVP